jgi:hypothetical protein
MNNKKHSIIWEKWRDPFLGYDENDIDIEAESIPPFINDLDEETDEDGEETPTHLTKTSQPVRVIATPMGLIPYNEYTASGKIFNFWIGHTNFNITKNIARIIETTNGIETLDIFTRYRFRIAIGKAFEDRKIMKAIDDRINKALGNNSHE